MKRRRLTLAIAGCAFLCPIAAASGMPPIVKALGLQPKDAPSSDPIRRNQTMAGDLQRREITAQVMNPGEASVDVVAFASANTLVVERDATRMAAPAKLGGVSRAVQGNQEPNIRRLPQMKVRIEDGTEDRPQGDSWSGTQVTSGPALQIEGPTQTSEKEQLSCGEAEVSARITLPRKVANEASLEASPEQRVEGSGDESVGIVMRTAEVVRSPRLTLQGRISEQSSSSPSTPEVAGFQAVVLKTRVIETVSESIDNFDESGLSDDAVSKSKFSKIENEPEGKPSPNEHEPVNAGLEKPLSVTSVGVRGQNRHDEVAPDATSDELPRNSASPTNSGGTVTSGGSQDEGSQGEDRQGDTAFVGQTVKLPAITMKRDEGESTSVIADATAKTSTPATMKPMSNRVNVTSTTPRLVPMPGDLSSNAHPPRIDGDLGKAEDASSQTARLSNVELDTELPEAHETKGRDSIPTVETKPNIATPKIASNVRENSHDFKSIENRANPHDGLSGTSLSAIPQPPELSRSIETEEDWNTSANRQTPEAQITNDTHQVPVISNKAPGALAIPHVSKIPIPSPYSVPEDSASKSEIEVVPEIEMPHRWIDGALEDEMPMPSANRLPVDLAIGETKTIDLDREIIDVVCEDESHTHDVTIDGTAFRITAHQNFHSRFVVGLRNENGGGLVFEVVEVVAGGAQVSASASVDRVVRSEPQDLGTLDTTIHTLYPNSAVRIVANPDGTITVSGRAMDERQARKILQLVRKLCLLPVHDRLFIESY